MNYIKSSIKKVIPEKLIQKITTYKKSYSSEMNALNGIPSASSVDSSSLQCSNKINLKAILVNEKIGKAWEDCKEQLNALAIPDLTGGINLGDRKAIFFLICFFQPKSVLEVGTHIGASTLNIAVALQHLFKNKKIKPSLRTIDVRDVNSPQDKPWLTFESPCSPKEMLHKLDLNQMVDFVHQDSLDYLRSTKHTYDFIFLDGDHSAKTVYQEIPLALERLNPNGVILLHDYFPNGKTHWGGRSVYGSYLAVKRHIEEGAPIAALPIGELPWKTKHNSYKTSLTLLTKKLD